MRVSVGMLLVLTLGCSGQGGPANERSAPRWEDGYGDSLGTVRFDSSCNDEADRYFRRGLALFHHMTYAGASGVFDSAIKADPECAIAYWGRAMTIVHWRCSTLSIASTRKGRITRPS